MKPSSLRLLSLLGILLLSSVWLFAQTETGTLTGIVTDASGAVVTGATVTVTSVGTGAARSATTASVGEYTITTLKAGTYQLTIEKAGFQKYTRQVSINVGSVVDVSAKLAVTGASTTVEVTASGETAEVNTESQTLSTVVSGRELVDLPTLTRNPYDLVSTSGNVSNGDSGQATRGVGYAINGQRSASTDILLDGGENVDLFTSAVGQSVPLDSVQEFRISTNNFTAEYGRASGGVVNVTTKSGTNQFHGTLFEFNRLSALASNTYDNNAKRAAAFADGTCVSGATCQVGQKGGFTRNQFGYSIGGPIVKNKVFFFSATEWTRVRSNNLTTEAIVDPAFLALPSCPNPLAPNGNCVAQATKDFYANVPSSPRSSLIVLNHIPYDQVSSSGLLPAGTPLAETVQYSVPSDSGGGSPQNTYSTVNRVDWNISDKSTLYGRYALASYNYFAGVVNSSPYSGYDTGETDFNQNVIINFTHVFTPSLVNSAKVIYNRLTQKQPLGTNPVGPTLYASSIGVPQIGPNSAQFVFPGYSQTTPGNSIPFGGPQNLYQFYDDLSWTKGRHTFKFGGLYIQTRDNRTFGAYENAVDSFNAAGNSGAVAADKLVYGVLGAAVGPAASLPRGSFTVAVDPQGKFPCYRDPNYGGSNPALLYIKTPACTANLPLSAPAFNRNNRYNDGAFYAQDSWKATARLTVNLGVRWEYYGVQHNSNPALDSNFYSGSGSSIYEQIQNGTVQIGNQSPVGGLWAQSKNNWAPRVGIAWDVFGNGTLSFRGGYGISYERNFGNVTFNVIQNPPAQLTVALNVGKNRDIGTLPIMYQNFGPLSGQSGTQYLPGASLRAVDQNIKQAYANFWSAAIDYQVLKNSVLSLEYAGSHGVHTYSIANINKPYFGGTYLGEDVVSNRLNQQYTNINYRGSDGFNMYNAVNVKFQSSNLFNKGLFINANYTWSHAIDDLSSTFSEGGNGSNQLGFTDPFNPVLDKGNSEYDIRQRFVFSGTWNLPWGNNASTGWVREVVGGWQVSPIYAIRTGSPYTIYDCSNGVSNCPRWIPNAAVSPSGGLQQAVGPNLFPYLYLPYTGSVSDGTAIANNTGDSLEIPNQQVFCGSSAPNNWRQYSCSGAPMGNRNSYQGPINWTFNMVIAKNFKLTERYQLQFRSEFYNMFNHSNLYVQTANNDVTTLTGQTDLYGNFIAPQVQVKKGVNPSTVSNEHRDIQFGLKLIF